MNIKIITKGEYETIIADDGEYIRFNGSDDEIYRCIARCIGYEPVFNTSEIKAALEIHQIKSEMCDLFHRIENKIISYGWNLHYGDGGMKTKDLEYNYKFVYHHKNLPPIEIERYGSDENNLVVNIDGQVFRLSNHCYDQINFYYIIVGFIVDKLIRK